jgi:excisionase family DNA binding protein
MQETLSQFLANVNHLLDVNDVAELLSMRRDTIYRYCKEGFLPHLKIGTNLRFDPKTLAAWVQVHQFSAGGKVADKITDWVEAHVLDRTLNLPVPAKLAGVINSLSSDWLPAAKVSWLERPGPDKVAALLEAFKSELELQLTPTEQRELLAELLWLGVYCA